MPDQFTKNDQPLKRVTISQFQSDQHLLKPFEEPLRARMMDNITQNNLLKKNRFGF